MHQSRTRISSHCLLTRKLIHQPNRTTIFTNPKIAHHPPSSMRRTLIIHNAPIANAHLFTLSINTKTHPPTKSNHHLHQSQDRASPTEQHASHPHNPQCTNRERASLHTVY